MKLIKQVCSLEDAKKLSELGIVQGKSLFFYDTWMADKNKLQYNSGHQSGDGYKGAESCFSAFTVAELFMLLPTDLENEDEDTYWPTIGHIDDEWNFNYACYDETEKEPEYRGHGCITDGWYKSLPEAMAEYLIWLIKNKKVSVKTCNERLLQE